MLRSARLLLLGCFFHLPEASKCIAHSPEASFIYRMMESLSVEIF